MNYSPVGTFLYFDENGKLADDLSWWYRLLDSVEGRIEDVGNAGTDGIEDHSMDRDVKWLDKNQNFNPFA